MKRKTRPKKKQECQACKELDTFLNIISDYAQESDPILLELIINFWGVDKIGSITESLKDEFFEAVKDKEEWFIDTVELDSLDITGLEGYEAQVLALKLASWNGPGSVYNFRAGKRYLHKRIRVLNMLDPDIMALDSYETLVDSIKGKKEVTHSR